MLQCHKKKAKFTYCYFTFLPEARRAGSNGSMSASGSAGPGFDPQLGSKFSFEKFSTSRLGGVEMYTF